MINRSTRHSTPINPLSHGYHYNTIKTNLSRVFLFIFYYFMRICVCTENCNNILYFQGIFSFAFRWNYAPVYKKKIQNPTGFVSFYIFYYINFSGSYSYLSIKILIKSISARISPIPQQKDATILVIPLFVSPIIKL